MFIMMLTIFFSGLFVFSSKRKHLLLTLLSIEFMVLGVVSFIFFDYGYFNYFFMLIYLTFAACEGALGLSILVSMSRSYGSDYFSVFNFS